MTLLEADNIRGWIGIEKILQRNEPAAPGANDSDFHSNTTFHTDHTERSVAQAVCTFQMNKTFTPISSFASGLRELRFALGSGRE
jgi:hypothetical protein